MPSLSFQPSRSYALSRCLVAVLLAVSFILSTTPALFAQDAVHVVQPGDSLSAIAVRYGVTMSELAAANGISNSNHVWVGQQLMIPNGSGGGSSWSATSTASSGATVTVGRGDSLSLIASIHGMTVQELMDLNGLANPNHVWVGQQLQVYGRATSTNAASSSVDTSSVETGNTLYHVVQPGESLSAIAVHYGVAMQSVMDFNGLWDPNNVRVGQRLAIVGGRQPAANAYYAPPAGRKRIVVDLSDQTLTAWYGDTIQLYTSISSGTSATPTITGYYKIDRKYPQQRMIGPGYDIPDVPYVMYFWEGYAFHGVYWHNNFGSPMSHGCIHVQPGQDAWLYSWAEPGTDVYINW